MIVVFHNQSNRTLELTSTLTEGFFVAKPPDTIAGGYPSVTLAFNVSLWWNFSSGCGGTSELGDFQYQNTRMGPSLPFCGGSIANNHCHAGLKPLYLPMQSAGSGIVNGYLIIKDGAVAGQFKVDFIMGGGQHSFKVSGELIGHRFEKVTQSVVGATLTGTVDIY